MIAPREARPTVRFIDEYCQSYQSLFSDVRAFEAFKHLHVGMLSDIKRKTLPAIAKVVGLDNEQSLHHFLTDSPWSVGVLEQRRLELILQTLQGRSILLLIDETGDPKKGKTTDYVKRQYIGNLGKIENGIVSVTAYGLIDNMTFPLMFRIYNPRERLKPGDKYQSKPQIAADMVRALQRMGFNIELVLADSLYGESEANFISVLEGLELEYVVAIRSNHGVWMPESEEISHTEWQSFEREFSTGKTEERFIREILYGHVEERVIRYWQITTDVDKLPDNSTWYVMTKKAGLKPEEVGDLYGKRNWVEYGLKQSKNELGWADFRVTDYAQIEKWWEVVMSAYLLVSLHSNELNPMTTSEAIGNLSEASTTSKESHTFASHQWWDRATGWKNLLNNLRLMLQPFVFFNLINPWLNVFPIQPLREGFRQLIEIMNRFPGAIPNPENAQDFQFSSA
ncbi:IS701 family transposase [Okeania sp. SIO2B9]|uniref:IS701 family transposase n=1 Tax=Okeania sp. SIO2B9 TaxID=2607782 RepID=UPI00142A3EDF|nr:IS701 family transposase [Okeania sp. SIO2B9]NES93160.1 IS701 family transposase [Okeania sp. SIO2B9]